MTDYMTENMYTIRVLRDGLATDEPAAYLLLAVHKYDLLVELIRETLQADTDRTVQMIRNSDGAVLHETTMGKWMDPNGITRTSITTYHRP